jgi:biopolymer transport protein ExbD
MHERKRQSTDHVDPDLPITPMLDMSFQLLAFFVITFRPSPTEGQIALALPKEVPPGHGMRADFGDPTPAVLIVRVTAADNGTIERVTLAEEDGAGVKVLGANVETLRDELTAVAARLSRGNQTGRLTLELDDRLIQEYVVQLMDTGVRTGFADLSPVPLDPKKR